jgi:hypothetical protein
MHSIRESAHKLHDALCRYWPCKCGRTHSGKLGECYEAKLLLGPNWNSGKIFEGKFDLLLRGPAGIQECEICVEECV